MIRIVRPVEFGRTQLSVRSFEEHFQPHIGGACDLRVVPTRAWLLQITGPAGALHDADTAARNFAEAVGDADFVCPGHDTMSYAPLLAALRNRARSPARFILLAINSAPYAPYWALLRPLLRAGDRIVSPSRNSRHLVERLCPEILPFVRVLRLPVEPLPGRREGPSGRDRVVTSICRIVPTKLVHRQIEALAVLKGRGAPVPRMNIVGRVRVGDESVTGAYARSLGDLVRRNGLRDQVRFLGAVWDRGLRGALMEESDALVNLSVAPEETTGTAAVEAMSVGTPVLATCWDGLVDTVGRAGELVPLAAERDDLEPSVEAEVVADHLARLLEAPPAPGLCREEASRFAPEATVPAFVAMCREALAERDAGEAPGPDAFDPEESEPAAPRSGLLSVTAPLTAMAWTELFGHYRTGLFTRRPPGGGAGADEPLWPRLQNALLAATVPYLMREMVHPPLPHPAADRALPGTPPAGAASANPLERALLSGGEATLTSRIACIRELRQQCGDEALAHVDAALDTGGARRPDAELLRADAALARGDAADAYRIAAAALHAFPAREGERARLEHLAGLAGAAGRVDEAAAVLRAWLRRHPAAPDSGRVWLALCECCARALPPRAEEAREALEEARALLGATRAVERAGELVAACGEPAAAAGGPLPHARG